MAGAFEIVMAERKALVDKIISMMKRDGGFFHNASEWDRAALRPQNPLSKVWYRGGNRMKLMAIVTERGYRDPRWCTAKQLFEKGYHIRAGEHGTICEKWIFEKEKKTKDEHGNIVKEVVQLDRPQVMYFRVFNGEQVEDFPEYVPPSAEEARTQLGVMIDQFIDTSECPIIEAAQDRAYYSPSTDKIVLPLRSMFKDEESFAKTLIHEAGHSTGAPSRLNRPLGGMFGSEEYAKEELRAEIGALFTEADLGISLKGEHYEDHSDYEGQDRYRKIDPALKQEPGRPDVAAGLRRGMDKLPADSEYMTVDEAVRISGFSRTSVSGWIRNGCFPVDKAGRSVRIRRTEFAEWLVRHKAGEKGARIWHQ